MTIFRDGSLAVGKQGPPADVWISLSGTGGKPVE
jgi:hypothetical protein